MCQSQRAEKNPIAIDDQRKNNAIKQLPVSTG